MTKMGGKFLNRCADKASRCISSRRVAPSCAKVRMCRILRLSRMRHRSRE
jgi:hypothetical protein